MNEILLINRIDPHNYSNDKRKIFFLIGRLNILEEEEKLIRVLNSIDILEKTDILYKYNGVVLNIKLKQIPKINKILAKENIEIYSIFEMYDPKL